MPEKIPSGVRSMIVRNHKSKTDHPQGNASRFCITPEKPRAFRRNFSHTGYDMHGNLFEWTHDWFGEYGEAALVDPVKQKMASYRVLRGGSWSRAMGPSIC